MAIENNDNQTLIGQVEEYLRKQIRDGERAVGSKLPSMRQLSNTLGCSLGIVQMAINTLSAEGYLKSLPRQGVFVAEPPTRKQDVVLILPSASLELMGGIIRGVWQGLRGTGLHLLIQASDSSFDDQVHLLEHLNKQHLAGVIIFPPTTNDYVAPLRIILESDIPALLATFRLDGLEMNTVCWDDFETGRMAAQYLVDRGHTKIGLVGFDADSRTGTDVLDGLNAVLRPKNISIDDLLRCEIDQLDLDADTPWMNSELACTKYFSDHPELTAVIASGQHPALGAYRAAKALGIPIPEQLSLVAIGYDIQAFALLDPAVTVVDSSLESVCERAVTRLCQLIEGGQGTPTTVQIPPRLIERGSVKNLKK